MILMACQSVWDYFMLRGLGKCIHCTFLFTFICVVVFAHGYMISSISI